MPPSLPTALPAASRRRSPGCWRKRKRWTPARTASSKDQRGDGLPEGLTKAADRQARLMVCKAKLEKRAAEAVARQQAKIDARRAEEQATGKRRRGRKPKAPDPSVDSDAVANVTDLESGIMKTRQGWVQGYNAQIVVTRDQIILAAGVTTEANDSH